VVRRSATPSADDALPLPIRARHARRRLAIVGTVASLGNSPALVAPVALRYRTCVPVESRNPRPIRVRGVYEGAGGASHRFAADSTETD